MRWLDGTRPLRASFRPGRACRSCSARTDPSPTAPTPTATAAAPTPTGRFTVTDKITPGPDQPYYGCCLLALSGHQPYLRPGWAGGDRIAIHGGGTIGAAASAGCLHASESDLRVLMRVVPLGTPVYIKA